MKRKQSNVQFNLKMKWKTRRTVDQWRSNIRCKKGSRIEVEENGVDKGEV